MFLPDETNGLINLKLKVVLSPGVSRKTVPWEKQIFSKNSNINNLCIMLILATWNPLSLRAQRGPAKEGVTS
jgi:hypothetical protein